MSAVAAIRLTQLHGEPKSLASLTTVGNGTPPKLLDSYRDAAAGRCKRWQGDRDDMYILVMRRSWFDSDRRLRPQKAV
jgi:hypothetical protein